MDEFGRLLLILGAIYLAECFLWVPAGSLVVLERASRWRGIAHPSAALGNARGGLVFQSLLPFDSALAVHPWPVSVSPTGLLALVTLAVPSGDPSGADRPPHLFPDHPRFTVDDSGRLKASGETLLVLGGRAQPGSLGGFYAGWPKPIRKIAIRSSTRALRRSLSVPGVRLRVRRLEEGRRTLRLVSTVLFLFVFAALPVLSVYNGIARFWPSSWPVMFSSRALRSRFWRGHSRLYPDLKGERWRQAITVALAPTSAMRAGNRLAHNLLGGFQPLAVVLALCPDRVRRAYACAALLDARSPMAPVCPIREDGAEQIEGSFREKVGTLSGKQSSAPDWIPRSFWPPCSPKVKNFLLPAVPRGVCRSGGDLH